MKHWIGHVFVTLGLAPWSATTVSYSDEPTPVFDGNCRHAALTYLTSPTAREAVDKLETEPALKITRELARFAHFLRVDFARQKLTLLSEADQKRCASEALKLADQIGNAFTTRARELVTAGKITAFYEETLVWKTTISENQESALFEKAWVELEPLYLQALLKGLFKHLEKTPWDSWRYLDIALASWSGEWKTLLGFEAPAAVHFEERRIALKPLLYRPLELQLFLFHELSHLADPKLKTAPRTTSERFENEVFAWRETIAFVEWLETQKKIAPPDLFATVRKAAHDNGLENWVRLVLGY